MPNLNIQGHIPTSLAGMEHCPQCAASYMQKLFQVKVKTASKNGSCWQGLPGENIFLANLLHS
jgi:hypothetical protein